MHPSCAKGMQLTEYIIYITLFSKIKLFSTYKSNFISQILNQYSVTDRKDQFSLQLNLNHTINNTKTVGDPKPEAQIEMLS